MTDPLLSFKRPQRQPVIACTSRQCRDRASGATPTCSTNVSPEGRSQSWRVSARSAGSSAGAITTTRDAVCRVVSPGECSPARPESVTEDAPHAARRGARRSAISRVAAREDREQAIGAGTGMTGAT